ncbi:MAG: flagellar FlbD family protein [Armatimonadota bacterium]
MIYVTRLSGEEIVVNAGLIEFLESTPDTLITLLTGQKFMVRESLPEVIERIVAYQQRIGQVMIRHLPPGVGDDITTV